MDTTAMMDPEVAAAMAAQPRRVTSLHRETLADHRKAMYVAFDAAPPDGVVREDRVIPGAPGDPDVAIRVFRPARPAGPVPAFVWVHGGGYIMGSQEADKPRLDGLVKHVGCLAVSIEYRLAPETAYPGPLEDCYAALAYVVKHADELGVDVNRIAIGGGSAGGGLAAGLALLARDRGIPLVHQHLIYPMLDDRQVTASSRWIVPSWTTEMNTFGWQSYLGDLYGTEGIPGYAAPSRAADLRGLPPAYIHVGTLDGFLHEDMEYAARLLEAGVPTELHVFPGTPHGFEVWASGTAIARQATALSRAALARVLTPQG